MAFSYNISVVLWKEAAVLQKHCRVKRKNYIMLWYYIVARSENRITFEKNKNTLCTAVKEEYFIFVFNCL